VISRNLAAALAATLFLAPAASGQSDRGSGKNVVHTFERFCLAQPATLHSAAASVQKDGWTAAAFPADFRTKAETKQAWSGTIDGRAFELIVTQDSRARRFGTTCLLRTAAKERFYPYFDEFRTAMARAGLHGRETDVPHFYRASGKLPDGRLAESILSTRFPAGRTNYTALQVTY
jgi:hypothetical protein